MEWLWKSFQMVPRYSPWYTIFFYMYNPNIWMEAKIKFIKEPFQLIPIDLDLWDSTKNSSCERKKYIFLNFSTPIWSGISLNGFCKKVGWIAICYTKTKRNFALTALILFFPDRMFKPWNPKANIISDKVKLHKQSN